MTPTDGVPAPPDPRVPSPTPRRRIGPGLVAGISDDDPSAIGTYSQIGAGTGYALLWAPFVALPIMAAAQLAASRIGTVRRAGIVAVAREFLPRWLAFIVFVPIVVTNVFTLGADLHAMASAAALVVPLPELLLLVTVSVVTVALRVAVPERISQGLLRGLALGILAYFGVVIAADIEWSVAIDALVHPRLAPGATGVTAVIAVMGATVSPYVLVWQPTADVLESAPLTAPQNASSTARLFRPDLVAGVVVAMLAGAAVIIATAATLRPAGITTAVSADQAARALEPLLGQGARTVFALGIVAVGLLAAPVLAGGAAIVTTELLGWQPGMGRRLRDAPGHSVVLLSAVGGSLALGVVGVDPVRALYIASILNGITVPALLAVLVVLARSRRVLGQHRVGRATAALLILGAGIGVALPVTLLVAWFRG